MGVISWTWAEYKRRRFDGVHLGPAEAELLLLLVLRRTWSYPDIIEAMWADAPDGGPEWARSSIHVLTRQINRKLVGLRVYSPSKGFITIDPIRMLRAA